MNRTPNQGEAVGFLYYKPTGLAVCRIERWGDPKRLEVKELRAASLSAVRREARQLGVHWFVAP